MGDSKSLEEGGRDYVMMKLGETIQPMKESFIVANLAWKGAREENMVVPKEIQDYRDAHGIDWRIDDALPEVGNGESTKGEPASLVCIPVPAANGVTPSGGAEKPTSSGAENGKP